MPFVGLVSPFHLDENIIPDHWELINLVSCGKLQYLPGMAELSWPKILKELEAKFSRPNFVTWLRSTQLIQEGEGLYSLTAANDYAKNWLEKNALKLITEQIKKQTGQLYDLRVVIAKSEASTTDLPLLQVEEEKKPTTKKSVESLFSPNYTFETLIVGNNNRLAFAAAQAVAEKPGQSYNPLFIYGGVGLGKTHLMQAIGNELVKNHPAHQIVYVSCETFTSEFIQALREKTIDQFKKKYRQADVLLIDDIQFISNKEGTQEEFFHTFNILHQHNRQIVIASDRVPKDIPDLEERLSSRLGWGMIADIQTPNLETRIAILEKKAAEQDLKLSSPVVEYIASTITSNVRELEGSLNKLATASLVEKNEIDLEFTKRVLKDLTHSEASHLTTKKVIRVVADYFNIEPTDILGKKRVKELVYPRQLVMYILREKLGQSFPQIGESLGGKDHTTIMYGCQKIILEKKARAEVEQDLNKILTALHV